MCSCERRGGEEEQCVSTESEEEEQSISGTEEEEEAGFVSFEGRYEEVCRGYKFKKEGSKGIK